MPPPPSTLLGSSGAGSGWRLAPGFLELLEAARRGLVLHSAQTIRRKRTAHGRGLAPGHGRSSRHLRDGPVCLTSLGWIRQDEERLASSRVSERQLRFAHLLRLREAHRWFALEAMTADDPTASLDALDALAAALSSPGCLIDAMIVRACGSMRDRAFARLAVRGELPPERLERWIAEPAKGTSWVADAGVVSDSSTGLPSARTSWQGAAWATTSTTRAGCGVGERGVGLRRVPRAPRGRRGAPEGHRGREQGAPGIRPGRRPGLAIRPHGRHADFDVHGRSALACRAPTGPTRCPGCPGVPRAKQGPEHGGGAREWVGPRAAFMNAGAWDVALAYERLGETRYRIAVDPNSPIPAVLEGPARRLTCSSHPWAPPQQAVSRAALGGFELQLPRSELHTPPRARSVVRGNSCLTVPTRPRGSRSRSGSPAGRWPSSR